MRTRSDIGRCTSNGPCHTHAAESNRSDVGCSLCNQLAIRAMSPARHSVGHDCRKQGFDRSKECYGDGIRQDNIILASRMPEGSVPVTCAEFSEPRSDSRNIEIEKVGHKAVVATAMSSPGHLV